MNRILVASLFVALGALPLVAQEKDKRLTDSPRDYNHGVNKKKGETIYFPWDPPATKDAWEARKPILKEQLLVSQGMWPMPEKVSLNPTVHGKIERDGYTIEKVFSSAIPAIT